MHHLGSRIPYTVNDTVALVDFCRLPRSIEHKLVVQLQATETFGRLFEHDGELEQATVYRGEVL